MSKYTLTFTYDELMYLRSALLAERAKFRDQEDEDATASFQAMSNLLEKTMEAEKEN